MAVTMADISHLRKMSGAGMMDCKKALEEANGDFDKAMEIIRKKGQAVAAKRSDREASEGCVLAADNGEFAAVVAVKCETDFVAKNEVFQGFVQSVADKALASSLKGGKDGEDIETLLDQAGLKEELVEKTATIGEKLSIRRFERVEGDIVVSYLHAGGKIGVLAAGTGANDDAAKEALANIAMQIAAMNPQYISRADMAEEEVAKLREITVDSWSHHF